MAAIPTKFVPGKTENAAPEIKSAIARVQSIAAAATQGTVMAPEKQKRVMAMVRMMAPVIDALIKNPGTAAAKTDRIEALTKIIDVCSTRAKEVIDAAGCQNLERQTWVQMQAFEMVARELATDWEKHGNIDETRVLCFDALKAATSGIEEHGLHWLENSGNITPIKNENDAVSRVRLSAIKAMAPLYSEIRVFSFWRDRIGQTAINILTRKLVEDISEIVASTANRFADQNGLEGDHRIMLWQSLTNRAFEIAASEYRKLANDTKVELNMVGTTGNDEEYNKKAKTEFRKSWATSDERLVGILSNRTRGNLHTLFELSHAFAENYETKMVDETASRVRAG